MRESDERFLRELQEFDIHRASREELLAFATRWSLPLAECYTKSEQQEMDLRLMRDLVDVWTDRAADAINSVW